MQNLSGKNVVLLGHFSALSRGQAEQYLNVLGARVRRRIDDDTEVVFVGSRPGAEQSRARALSLPLLRERELLAALGLTTSAEDALVEVAWTRIEAWLHEHAPTLALPEPAPVDALEALTEAFGQPVPEVVAQSFARHNGAPGIHGASPPGGLMSSEACGEALRVFRENAAAEPASESGAQQDHRIDGGWSERWLPIWSNSRRDVVCALDLAPSASGRTGQVIEVHLHGASRVVRADSFGLWLHAFAHDLENGCYAYNGRELSRIESDPER